MPMQPRCQDRRAAIRFCLTGSNLVCMTQCRKYHLLPLFPEHHVLVRHKLSTGCFRLPVVAEEPRQKFVFPYRNENSCKLRVNLSILFLLNINDYNLLHDEIGICKSETVQPAKAHSNCPCITTLVITF